MLRNQPIRCRTDEPVGGLLRPYVMLELYLQQLWSRISLEFFIEVLKVLHDKLKIGIYRDFLLVVFSALLQRRFGAPFHLDVDVLRQFVPLVIHDRRSACGSRLMVMSSR